MIYNLEFKPKDTKEWNKLGSTVAEQFKREIRKSKNSK